METSGAESWSCDEVGQWLRQEGFSQYADFFSKEHQIDGTVLLSLTESDLRQPPLQLKVLGHIKRLILKIQDLRIACNMKDSFCWEESPIANMRNGMNRSKQKSHQMQRSSDSDSLPGSGDYIDFAQTNGDSYPYHGSWDMPTEIWKTALSFVYVFSVFMVTAFVMVVVHDRVPEMDKYPPLPDLFLDNMPYVPWAFDVCEMVGLVLCVIWFTILLFHKHRFILMRRWFSLMGTIFLLRCVTMLITSLSVPGRHLQCSGKTYGTLYAKLQRTFAIWQGMGMSLQGVRTCGDYMFSGHTSVITLLNFFITEYTPRRFYHLHIISWCLNFFGIFFLLAAHEHYSIDVFIAFYLNSRLFMYYHTLANNRALMQQDANRTRVWFPLFAFFEAKCDGRVPHEFEWPFCGLFHSIVNRFSLRKALGEEAAPKHPPNSNVGNNSQNRKSPQKSVKKRKGSNHI